MKHALLVVFALASGCAFDVRVPSSTTVECPDGRCPVGFVCRARVGLCFPVADTVGEAPRVTAGQVDPPRAKSGDTVHVTLTASEPLVRAPVVTLLESSGTRPLTLDAQDGLNFRYAYIVDRAVDDEGSARVVADLTSSTGAEALAQLVGVVTFDFTPPALIASSARVTLEPPPNCPLAAVHALSSLGAVHAELSLDEPGRAELQAAPESLTFTAGSQTSTHFSFVGRMNDGASQGLVALSVRATDAVGNTATLPLGEVTIDTHAPFAPDVNSPTAIVYQRAPWGSRDGGVRFGIVGAAGAVDPGMHVQVLDQDAPLALVAADDAGFRATLRTAQTAPSSRCGALTTRATPALWLKSETWSGWPRSTARCWAAPSRTRTGLRRAARLRSSPRRPPRLKWCWALASPRRATSGGRSTAPRRRLMKASSSTTARDNEPCW